MRRARVSLASTLAVLGLICFGSGSVAQIQSLDTSPVGIRAYRGQMSEIAGLFMEVGANVGDPRVQALAAEFASSVGGLSDDDLSMLISVGADLSYLRTSAAELAEMTAPESGPASRGRGAPDEPTLLTRGTLPDAPYNPTCPPPRSDTLALQIAINTLQAARTVLAVAQRGCDLVVVVCPAPGGGNPQTLACSPFDIALDLAQAVVENFRFCDADIDSAEILGSYNRLEHIHDDLTTHDTDLKAQVATHDADLKSQLATHDADIKSLLGDIQGTVDENQRLIKIFMARQLETMRLLITPQGNREVDEEVLACTGDDCPVYPDFQLCPNGSLKWNCRR